MSRSPKKATTTTAEAKAKLADPKIQARLAKNLKSWNDKMRPLVEASRSAERLTEKDFAIRINAKA